MRREKGIWARLNPAEKKETGSLIGGEEGDGDRCFWLQHTEGE